MAKLHYTNQRLVNVIPQVPGDLVSMEWVENYVIGKVKMPVRAISRLNLAGTYAAGVSPAPVTKGTFVLGTTGALIIDGVTLNVGDRVLLAGQTDGTQNGIYEVTVAGDGSTAAALVRAEDWDTNDQIFAGVRIHVNEGTLYAGTSWKLEASGTPSIDTTVFTFVQAGAASATSKYAETITGDGVETAFTIQHNLGTTDVVVSVYNMTTNAEVGVDVVIDDLNSVIIGFDTAPEVSPTFRVVVIG